jgi:hypothetical protein
MIAKSAKGKGFRGALDYDLGKEQGRVIDSNMAGHTPRELAAEFGEIRRLRPSLGKAVLHVSLSAAPGEKLTDTQWRDIGRRYLDGMGLDQNQFIATRHSDTGHEHIHILANRIRFDGSVTSDSHDWRRQEALMREIERDFGLQRVAPSHEAERRAPTQGEIERSVRTGEASTRAQLQQLADAAVQGCRSYTEYQERLEAAGVELVPVVQLSGAKLSGLSYRLDGVTMKGSDLGKGYSPAGLAKRGITYEQDTDLAAVRRSLERDARRGAGEPDRGAEAGPAPERGGAGRGAGADRQGDGRANGRDAGDAERDRRQGPGPGRDVHPAAEHVGPELEGRGRTGAEGGREPRPGREPAGVEPLRAGDRDGAADSGPRERLLALAGAAERAEPAGREGDRPAPEARRDRSLEAVQRQVTALGVARFDVVLRDAGTGQTTERQWSRAEIEGALAWLKRMNARGSDIHIRPAGEHGLVLVDGLKAEAIECMKRDGFAPAATVETHPGSYQAWIKVSQEPLSHPVRRIAAEGLAKHYEGNPGSADGSPYGRLAGFTNQDPQHARDGRQPYVLAHECPGKVAAKAPALRERIEEAIDRAAAREERQRRLEVLRTVEPEAGTHDPVREYRQQARRFIARHGFSDDYSRMDQTIATDMAKSGRFTVSNIERSIREGSPTVESRRAGHIEEYAKRTVEKAWAAPEVQQKRHEQEQERMLEQKLRRGRDGSSLSR